MSIWPWLFQIVPDENWSFRYPLISHINWPGTPFLTPPEAALKPPETKWLAQFGESERCTVTRDAHFDSRSSPTLACNTRIFNNLNFFKITRLPLLKGQCRVERGYIIKQYFWNALILRYIISRGDVRSGGICVLFVRVNPASNSPY